MLLSQLWANIAPLLLALLLGFAVGKRLGARQIRHCGRAITPLVWAILWVIGTSAGGALSELGRGLHIIETAACYALTTSLAAFVILLPGNGSRPPQGTASWWRGLMAPIKECALALSLVAAGAWCASLGWQHSTLGGWLFNINGWLYLLLFFIGIELTQAHLNRSWLSLALLKVPALVIIASLAAGALLSLLLNEKLTTALALSSGFGWYSLSAALAHQYLGEPFGMMALFIDLLRELLGIAVVFALGGRYARPSIGVCGATSVDTTLPFVRTSCDAQQLPTALVSGLILTLVGPFLMLFFMSL